MAHRKSSPSVKTIWKVLKFTGGWLAYSLWVFVLASLGIVIGGGLLLSAITVPIAADGSWAKASMAMALSFGICFALGTFLVPQITGKLTAAKVIKDFQIGKRLVTAALNEVDPSLLEKSESFCWTLPEFEELVQSHTRVIFETDKPMEKRSRIARWWIPRVRRLLDRYLVRLLDRNCGSGEGDDRVISASGLKAMAERGIDDYCASTLQNETSLATLKSMIGAAILVGTLASALAKLTFGG